MGLIPIWVWLIAIAVASAVGFGSGWNVKSWQVDASEKSKIEAQLEEIKKFAKAAEESGKKTELKLATFRVTQKTFYNETRNELTKTVYTDPNCNLPDTGWSLRNDHIREANKAINNPVGEVPKSGGDKEPKKSWRSVLPGQ